MQIAPEKLDIRKLNQYLSQLREEVTCLECCKFYTVPKTALCGHTLCHLCWKNRRTCPYCKTSVNRQSMKCNLPLQDFTEHYRFLSGSLEGLLNLKFDQLVLDSPQELRLEDCPAKNVNDWLEESQNYFFSSVINSEPLTQELQHIPNQESVTTKVQIHAPTQKRKSPKRIVHMPIQQDDSDKIEAIPKEHKIVPEKENIIGPMDIEPFYIQYKDDSIKNLRRSSRNKDLPLTPEENFVNSGIAKDSGCDTDTMSHNTKQNWNNVKRMRKEFSKLNKKNRSKLNVSIEMTKKAQNPCNKLNVELPVSINQEICKIDDDTQNNGNPSTVQPVKEKNINIPEDNGNHKNSDINNRITTNTHINKTTSQPINDDSFKEKDILEIPTSREQNNLSIKTIPNTNNSDFNEKSNKVQFFKRSFLYHNHVDNTKYDEHNVHVDTDSTSSGGDIDISIKIGNTVTNILIKQKKADVQVKLNMDRQVQTSLGPYHMTQQNNALNSKLMNVNNMCHEKKEQTYSNKSSVKKNTASADTATDHIEITESVEKELSNSMECELRNNYSVTRDKYPIKTIQPNPTPLLVPNAMDIQLVDSDDLDIFESETIREKNIKQKKSEYEPAAVLVSTLQSKIDTQNNSDKRKREINNENDVDVQNRNKKMKVFSEKDNNTNNIADCNDPLINQDFANINADIEDIQPSTDTQILKVASITDNYYDNSKKSNNFLDKLGNVKCDRNKKQSSHGDNLYSMVQSVNSKHCSDNKVHLSVLKTIEEVLTPAPCRILDDFQECSEQDSPVLGDSSDKYIVEDTPQKIKLFVKNNKKSDSLNQDSIKDDKPSVSFEKKKSVTSLNNKINTAKENVANQEALETPLTINKFVNHIMHKSTPVARKSLSFENQNITNYHERDETICPTAESVVMNTQEKEFMDRAFENTLEAIHKPEKNDTINCKKLWVCGSRLNMDELNNVKYLCRERNWTYVDKYINQVTHLVVAVDNQKKCERSLKYMRALAAGKWILSYEWVEKCLLAKKIVDEIQYEAFDYTGEPGPARSRITKRKLFAGITFFCMPPFSVLDIITLKDLLNDAGGVVVNEVTKIQITDGSKGPCILLAEPENTEETQFIYLAKSLSIVPVNFEWVLNCLGNYTLESIEDVLLCPMSLLPKAISAWPAPLVPRDADI